MSVIEEAKKQKRSSIKEVKSGHIMSELQFYKVHGGNDIYRIQVTNDRGFKFNVSPDIIEEGWYSASQFEEVKEVTRTELIQVFKLCWGAVFTVHFRKMPKEKEINEVVKSFNGPNGIIPIKEMTVKIKEAFKGEPRTVIGHMVDPDHDFGRSLVMDLDKQFEGNPPDRCFSQVDHRTIEWLIFKNVKWVAKTKATRTRKS